MNSLFEHLLESPKAVREPRFCTFRRLFRMIAEIAQIGVICADEAVVKP